MCDRDHDPRGGCDSLGEKRGKVFQPEPGTHARAEAEEGGGLGAAAMQRAQREGNRKGAWAKAWPRWAGTPEDQEALQAGVMWGLLTILDAGEKS